MRQPTRTSAVLWRNLGSTEAVRVAFCELDGFKSAERGHGRFQVSTSIEDHSVLELDCHLVGGRPVFRYELHVFYEAGGTMILRAGHKLGDEVLGTLLSLSRRDEGQELAVYPVHIDVQAIVNQHGDTVSQVYAYLNNTPGLKGMTVFGDDVVRSHLYEDVLSSSTLYAANLHNALGYRGLSLFVHANGNFSCDALLDDDMVRMIARRVIDEFST
jgi:hypothetical protein